MLSSSSPRPSALTVSPGRSSPGSTGELQRLLSDEAAERDEARLALARLRRAVAFYRQELGAVVQSGSSPSRGSSQEATASCVRRAGELVRQLESELRIAPESPTGSRGFTLIHERTLQPGSPTHGYDVMRQSLDEAQRRAESLNLDMVCQAEANEEFVEVLGSVKDANKVLLEQIRGQTQEIAQLTQHRISDEMRLQLITRQHREDGDRMRQDAQAKARSIRESADVQHAAMARRFNELKQQFRTRLLTVSRETADLQQERQRIRATFPAMNGEVQSRLSLLSREVEIQATGMCDVAAREREVLEESIENYELQLSSERERREADSMSWARRLAGTQADVDNIKASAPHELRCLTPQLQVLERSLGAERRTAGVEPSRLQQEIDEDAAKIVSQRQLLEQIQGQAVRTESAVTAAEVQVRSQEAAVAELRRHIRESDDMLAAAVSGNEHLRAQMAQQGQRFQERNEVDLSDARLALESKISDLQAARETDMNLASRQLQTMEQEMHRLDEALQLLKSEEFAASADCEALSRETSTWSSEHAQAAAAREAAMKEFGEAKKAYSIQRTEFQAGSDLMQSSMTSTEHDIQRLIDQMAELKRNADAREVAAETHASAGELAIKDMEAQLADIRRRLLEVLNECQRLNTDTSEEQNLDAQIELERQLDDTKRSCAEERANLGTLLATEQKATEHAKEQFANQHTAALDNLQLAHEESRCRLEAAERERTHVEEVRSRDLSQAADVAEQHDRRVEELTHNLERMRQLLNASSANLSMVQQEAGREEREAALEIQLLNEEVRLLDTPLESASREERSLTHQIVMAEETSFDRPSRSGNLPEASGRKELSELSPQGSPHISSSSRNGQTYALTGLHSRLEGQIQQLQAHTDELRSDVAMLASTAAAMSPRASAVASPAHAAILPASSGSPADASGGIRSPVPDPLQLDIDISLYTSPSRATLGLTNGRSPAAPAAISSRDAAWSPGAHFTTPPAHVSMVSSPPLGIAGPSMQRRSE